MPVPDFSPGEVLTAAAMDAVGLWRNTNCTVTSVGGTAATASNGVVTVGTNNTSVTVNNAFSSDYNAYKIVYTGGTGSAGTALQIQIGAAAAGYYGTLVYAGYGGAGAPLAVRDNNVAQFTYAGSTDTLNNWLNVEIHNPFNTTRTAIYGSYVEGGAGRNSGTYNGFLDNATSYTSVRIFPAAGNITGGTIRIYGYRL